MTPRPAALRSRTDKMKMIQALWLSEETAVTSDIVLIVFNVNRNSILVPFKSWRLDVQRMIPPR